jgi:hypothetical protein
VQLHGAKAGKVHYAGLGEPGRLGKGNLALAAADFGGQWRDDCAAGSRNKSFAPIRAISGYRYSASPEHALESPAVGVVPAFRLDKPVATAKHCSTDGQ